MEDLIKRSSALGVIDKASRAGFFKGDEASYFTVFDLIKKIPNADAQKVVRAKWIDKSKKGFMSIRYIYECSNCGYTVRHKPKSRSDGKGNKYCPNCGARMDKE